MADENKSGQQGAGKTDGQGDQNAQGGKAGSQDGEKHVSKESWDALLTEKKQEAEKNKKLQAQIDKIEADRKKADDAKLAADGKLQELVDSKDKDIAAKTERIRRAELKVAARGAGLIDMEYVDILMKSVKFDDQDQPLEVEAVFTELQKNKPYLFKQPDPDPKPGTNNTGASWKGGHAFTEAEINAMTSEDRQKNWPEILKQMGEGRIK
jgi:hypothetical protein